MARNDMSTETWKVGAVESMDVVYGVLDGVRVVRAWETVTA